MRSRCSVAVTLAGLAALATLATLGSCGPDEDAACSQSYLTYDNFGAAYMTNWCTGCHSAQLPVDMRQLAPIGMDFDTLDEVHAWSIGVMTTTAQQTMPPQGGPSDDERALLAQWITCGAP